MCLRLSLLSVVGFPKGATFNGCCVDKMTFNETSFLGHFVTNEAYVCLVKIDRIRPSDLKQVNIFLKTDVTTDFCSSGY